MREGPGTRLAQVMAGVGGLFLLASQPAGASAASSPQVPATRSAQPADTSTAPRFHAAPWGQRRPTLAQPPSTSYQLSTPPCQNGWTIISGPGTNGGLFNRIVSLSESDAWAVGGTGSPSGTPTATVAEHWDGVQWITSSTPAEGTIHAEFDDVAAVTSNDVWVVGGKGYAFDSAGTPLDGPLVNHWNGTLWSDVSTPTLPATAVTADLFGVAAVASNDVWAAGYWDDNTHTYPLAEHWDGSKWTINSPPAAAFGEGGFNAVTAIGTGDVWAVGSILSNGNGPLQPRAAHWNGSAWSSVSMPAVSTADNDILDVSHAGSSIWAAGYSTPIDSSVASRTLIERWTGLAWVVVPSPNELGLITGIEYANALGGIDVISGSDAWAVGAFYNATRDQPLIEHWDGGGWTIVYGPYLDTTASLSGVSGDGPTDVWAVGEQRTNSGSTLAQRFGPPVVNAVFPGEAPTSGGSSIQVSGAGFSCATGVQVEGNAAAGLMINSDTSLNLVTPPGRAGVADVLVANAVALSHPYAADQLTYVPLFVFTPNPIAPSGSLAAGQSQTVTVAARSYDGTAAPSAFVLLSIHQATGGGSASVGSTSLTATPSWFTADANGQVQIAYTAPSTLPGSGVDMIQAQSPNGFVVLQDTYDFGKTTTFYFAEGFTGNGFTESLDLLMPNQGGTATIEYFADGGQSPPVHVPLAAGIVSIENVNQDVGADHHVSAMVILPGPGMVERVLHFNNGSWRGSTDEMGVTNTATEWDFAEGSTLSIFNEFLALENPNPYPVVVDLNYATDSAGHPSKTLTLPPASRVSVEVYQGDHNDNGNCQPLTTCGMGPGLVGVSVQVKSRTLPIVAERPFYVNNYSFGSGPIRDGHDAFGANAPATSWNFAEGNTLDGFNEYLTLQNPGVMDAAVTVHYIDDLGTRDVIVPVPAKSRQTVLVFDPAHYGVGAGYVGVSVQITSDRPIVAERPMYLVHDFGSGPVAGAHDVVGSTGFTTLFGFAAASTAAGENDYLTIQNPNTVAASVQITYYTPTGPVTKTLAVAAQSRHTVLVFSNDGEGLGPDVSPLGIVVRSDQPVQVEKPTYSSNASTFGATDTSAYSPASF